MAENIVQQNLNENSNNENVPAKKPRLNEAETNDENIETDKPTPADLGGDNSKQCNIQESSASAAEFESEYQLSEALRYETSESDINSLTESSDEDETLLVESTASFELRKFKQTPVYIVEYHNDVLNFIFDCIRSRFMSHEGNTLIHFDSHPDMVIPRELSAKQAFDKVSLLNECSIESWIMPLCYTGIIKRIIWIKHPSCQQIPVGKHNFHIGSHSDRLYVDLAIPYFLSEATLCATSHLDNARSIELLVVDDFELNEEEKQKDEKINETFDWFIKENEPYILDIDLDFFCTKNPFLNLYTKCDYYNDISRIFALDDEVLDLDENNMTEANEHRLKTLNTLKMIFEHLTANEGRLSGYENNVKQLDAHKFNLLENLVKKLLAHYTPQEIDWMQIYDAGCTTDSGGLPSFEATAADLEAASERFYKKIMNLPHDPVLVTISRSSEDEFCPSTQVEEIQSLTIKMLGHKLAMHKPIRGDNNEDYNIMKL